MVGFHSWNNKYHISIDRIYKMTYFIGGDHYNNRIPHPDLQIFCHRVYAKLPYNLSDDELRHKLYTDVFSHSLYTRNDCSLQNFLSDCKLYNIVPVVNNNPTYLDSNVPIAEYARRSRIIDEIMYDAGFQLGYQSLMNEPGKRHTITGYVNYVNSAKAEIKHYKVIAGNDEYNMLDWNYLLDNGKFDILGVHPLSSLGYPPKWKILNDWATMATARGKPYMITEGGSWFKSYASLEGWTVMRDMILKAKNLNYLATLIVLLDVNEGMYPKLGFNRFTKDYKNIISVSDYWDDFIGLVNREGKKYKKEIIVEDDDMKLEVLKPGSDNNQVRWLQEILMLEFGYPNDFANPFDGKYGNYTRQQVEAYQEANGLEKDGYVGVNTTLDLLFDVDKKSAEDRVFSTDYWDKRLKILVAFKKWKN